MHFKMSSAKSLTFCLGLKVLNKWVITYHWGGHVQSVVLNLTPFIMMQSTINKSSKVSGNFSPLIPGPRACHCKDIIFKKNFMTNCQWSLQNLENYEQFCYVSIWVFFNTLWPGDNITPYGTWATFVLVMACPLSSTKPLPEPLLDPSDKIFVNSLRQSDAYIHCMHQ